MARIVSYKLHLLSRPHIVLATSYGSPEQKKSHVILELHDAEGHIGYGESTPLSEFTGETAETVYTVLEKYLLPLVIGRESFDLGVIHEKMDQALAENHAAKEVIDCAMYDLTAKAWKIPLYGLLGGCSRKSVVINRHIGVTSVENAVNMARSYVKKGFKCIKMKIGRDVIQDVARIRAVREAVGDSTLIRVDANGGYTYTEACHLIERVRDCDITYYEQLLPKWDLDGMVNLRRKYGIPVLLDEAVNSIDDAVRFASAGAADAFTIKLCKCGGLYPAKQIAAIAAAYHIKIIVASTYDTQIGCAACLHLACSLPNVEDACDLTTFATQAEWADTCHVIDYMNLTVGDEAGIGVRNMKDFYMEEK